jgi:hypothetical protein
LKEINYDENVFAYMIMAYVVKEIPADPAKKRPVNSRKGATEECPLLLAIVGNRGVRMMKISEHNNPFRNRGARELSEGMI